MTCKNCDNGYIEIDDMPVPCRKCSKKNKKAQADETVPQYVARLANLMGLEGWTFEVQGDPCDKDNMAEIDAVYGQRFAKVYLSQDWHTFSPELLRDTLVHELVHAHFAPMSELSHDLLDAAAKKHAKTAKAALSYMEERIVDQIACAWARTLPLPEVAS